MSESKAEWVESICPRCRGAGRLPQTPEEAKEAIRRGFVNAPLCPVCDGSGRRPVAGTLAD